MDPKKREKTLATDFDIGSAVCCELLTRQYGKDVWQWAEGVVVGHVGKRLVRVQIKGEEARGTRLIRTGWIVMGGTFIPSPGAREPAGPIPPNMGRRAPYAGE